MKTTISGTSNRVLEVDLTNRKSRVVEIDKRDRKLYLGGKGLGLKLLYDRFQPGIDTLGPENILVFMTGVLMGSGAPCSGRFVGITRSPLTGIIATSSCGGPFGMALKTTGWDGLIIRGKSAKPVYLSLDDMEAHFHDAKKLWGEDTEKTTDALSKDGKGSLVIGPAGENLVRFANIRSGDRFLGRGGLGAVMGSKNLKGIVAAGDLVKIEPVHKKRFDRYRKKATTFINRNEVTSHLYRKFGTNANMKVNNEKRILPVRNFTIGSHGKARRLYGQTLGAERMTGFHTCKPCTILCGHKGIFQGKERPVPEYETAGLFGPNLEIFDPDMISEWNEICSLTGMDTISAAVTLAWVMEAGEKGLYETDLRFGSPDGISRTLNNMAKCKGKDAELGRGSRWLAQKYGGFDFAMQVKGLEMAAYDPRGAWGQGLSYAVANRGACHLSTSAFTVEQYFDMIKPETSSSKASMVKFLEDTFAAVNSLHMCQFTGFPFELEPPLVKLSPTPVLRVLMTAMAGVAMYFMDISLWPKLYGAILGRRLSTLAFLKAGARIHVLERFMNVREGIDRQDDTLPERLTHEPRTIDEKGYTVPLEPMLNRYYRVRGFDRMGRPTGRTLRKYRIPEPELT